MWAYMEDNAAVMSQLFQASNICHGVNKIFTEPKKGVIPEKRVSPVEQRGHTDERAQNEDQKAADAVLVDAAAPGEVAAAIASATGSCGAGHATRLSATALTMAMERPDWM